MAAWGAGAVAARGLADDAAQELRRIVGINEAIKAIVTTAFKINLMALNAIFLAKKAGRAALGFGVLSNELRGFSVDLGKQMADLRSLTSGSVKIVTDGVMQTRRSRILDRTDRESKGRARELLHRAAADREEANLRRHGENLRALNRGLTLRLADTWRLVELGSVLARSAKIEAAYGGSFSAPLMQVSSDFEQTIGQIRAALELLRKDYLEQAR